MMQRYFVLVALVTAVMGTGCVSVSHVQTADTLGQGKFQFAMEPGVGGAAVFSDVGGGSVYYPHVDLALRYGVTDTVDLGVRFGSSLVELQSKFLLTSVQDTNKAISLAPSVMGVFFGSGDSSATFVNIAAPVLIGFKTGGGSEFVLGPRLVGTYLSGGSGVGGGSAFILSAGASVGYALRVSEGFRLMPEIGISIPFAGAAETSSGGSDADAGINGGIMQFKLGFLFGQGRPISRGADMEGGTESEAEYGTQPEAKPE